MMMKTHRALAAAAFVAAISAAPALAQDRQTYELQVITVEVLSSSHGLHQQAMDLYDQPERWEEAARLHLQAAESFRENAASSFHGFDRAARIFFYIGEYDDARRAMEEAVEVALATGDLVTAASASADVAIIALYEGYAGKTREFTQDALELANSDLVDEEDRDDILERIDGVERSSSTLAVAFLRNAD